MRSEIALALAARRRIIRQYCSCLLASLFVYRVSPALVILFGAWLPACSTHPLPEDVTDLPVYEIIHRIQCEAAREVGAQLVAAKLTGAYEKLKDLDERIKKLKEPIEKAEKKLKEAESDYGKSHAALQDAFDAVNLQIDQVLQKITRLESEIEALQKKRDLEKQKGSAANQLAIDEFEREQKRREDQANTLKQEAAQLYRQYKNIEAVASLVAAVDKAVSDSDEKLQQLLKDRKDERVQKLLAYISNNSVLQFVFTVTEDNNATTTGTITWPIDLGVITLGYSAGDSKTRKSDRQVRLVVSFDEYLKLLKPDKPGDPSCFDVVIPEETRFPLRYPITGEIGLAEVISDYIRVTAVKGGKFHPQTSNDSYRDKITFTTTLKAGLTPGINLSKRMGQLIQASADFTLNRIDVHELTIFLTPPAPAGSGGSAQEIIIREMPAVRVRTRAVEQSPAG
jgi:hypothetical protein